MLADLAEQGEPVVVRCGDRHHPGRVDVVGADHVVLHDDRGGRALVAYRAISSVSAARSSALARDPAARTVEATADLADTLRVLAEDRAAVLVHAAGADVGGELTAVGHDVVWLADVAVPLASIDWVMVR